MNIDSFKASYDGDIEKAKRDIVEYNLDKDCVFRWMCRRGHIELAKWLVEKHNVDVHTCDELAFKLACIDGHTELVRWLVMEHNVNVHADGEIAFRFAFTYSRTEIIDMFLNDLNNNEYIYAIRDKTAYIINHVPLNGWGSCVIFGIPVNYCGELDKSAVMAIIKPPKSARSY